MACWITLFFAEVPTPVTVHEETRYGSVLALT